MKKEMKEERKEGRKERRKEREMEGKKKEKMEGLGYNLLFYISCERYKTSSINVVALLLLRTSETKLVSFTRLSRLKEKEKKSNRFSIAAATENLNVQTSKTSSWLTGMSDISEPQRLD